MFVFFVQKVTFLLSKIYKKMVQLGLFFWLKYAPDHFSAAEQAVGHD